MRFETPQKAAQMAQVRGKKSMDLPAETPIGGWNTRDAIDNIPPSDAIVMDNWVPDLGSVKVRKGYIEHCDSGDITVGGELVLNPGFETAGPGPYPNVFADWDEDPGNGIIFQVTVGGGDYVHSGSHSCALSQAITGSKVPAVVDQTMAVTASTKYKYDLWALNGGAPGTFAWPSYAVYDVTNAAYIIPKTYIRLTTQAPDWERTRVHFETPVGCVSVRIEIYGTGKDDTYPVYDPSALPGAHSANVRIDDVSLMESHDPASVETLMVFDHEGDYKLIGADGGSIYNATTSPPVELGSGFNNDRWSWANFQDLLIMANSVDLVQQYDGTTLQAIVPALTGPSAPIGCHAFKYRMYYWDEDSQDVWYTALRAPGGVCTKFSLSEVGKRGGDLIGMFTWTHDGGSGPDDFAVFMMSSGETLVYQGSSPSSVADWGLVGIYDIGTPLGSRCGAKFGGDLMVLTSLDLLPMSQAMKGRETQSIQSKISGALRDVVGNSEYFGWAVEIFPEEKLLICNVPIVEGQTYYQFVLNLVTGAWCRFTGLLAHCWVNYDGRMFFGTDEGVIHEAFNGYTDLGNAIESDLQTAWLNFGTIDNKQLVSIKQTFRSDVSVSYNAAFATDFRPFSSIGYPIATAPAGSPWDTSLWDVSLWGAVVTVEQAWKMIAGYGRFVSMYTKTATKSLTQLLSNIWHLEQGTRM